MTEPQFKPYDNEETLRRLYKNAGVPIALIAEFFGVSQKEIKQALHRHSIEKHHKRVERAYFSTNHNGYEELHAHYSGKTDRVYVHQLILIAEGEDPHDIFSNGEYQCHHKNGIPWDNRSDNLVLYSRPEHVAIHAKRGDYSTENRLNYTDEELLSWIDAFVAEFGIVPATVDMRNWPGPRPTTYRNRFGSISKAIEEAGYSPRYD